jgi:nucleoside phosphorylase
MSSIFRTDHFLTEDDSPVYIIRKADMELVRRLKHRDYAFIIEPPKQGKTSLLYAIMRNPDLEEMDFLFLDLADEKFNRSSHDQWYTTITSELNRQLVKLEHPITSLPQDSSQWLNYLKEIAGNGNQLERPLVLICDNVNVEIPDAFGFFGKMREIFNLRNNDRTYKYFCVVLSGTFNPVDLINDQRLSPFNIARRIYLPNLSWLETRKLVDVGSWPIEQKECLSKTIYNLTNGQPYLIQWICSHLAEDGTEQNVNRVANSLLQNNNDYLLRMAQDLWRKPELINYLSRIYAHEKIGFFPTQINKQLQLELLGMIQEDEAGKCQFRSLLHQKVYLYIIPEAGKIIPDAVKSITEKGDVFQDQEADIVILTALSEEREAILQKLPGHELLAPSQNDIRTYHKASLKYETNETIGIYNLIILSLPGMGRVHAAIATADAIRRWKPKYILLVGIAGGVSSKGVNIGDLLIATQIIDYSLQKVYPKDTEIRWEVQQVDQRLLDACKNHVDNQWVDAIRVERPTPGQVNKFYGPIASGDRVIAYEKVLNELQETWKKMIGVEMEAGGVSTAVSLYPRKIGFFMVRSVSDLADAQKDTPQVDQWRQYSCDVAATYTIEFLKTGPCLI